MTTRIFVYGSLRRNQYNHRLLKRARFVGEARTRPEYELHDLGSFPAAVRAGGTAIVGEIYDVDGPTLERLDRLEGHPRMYRRTPIELEGGDVANIYLWVGALPRLAAAIPSGDWREHKERTRR